MPNPDNRPYPDSRLYAATKLNAVRDHYAELDRDARDTYVPAYRRSRDARVRDADHGGGDGGAQPRHHRARDRKWRLRATDHLPVVLGMLLGAPLGAALLLFYMGLRR